MSESSVLENVIRGELKAKGKTKRIWSVKGDPSLVDVEIKDDLTAGNGAKHDVLSGKGVFANSTICNVFELLKGCGLPVAFKGKSSANSFFSEHCKMLPFEVVNRREVHGSACKRYPFLPKGHRFERVIVEFFLKTSDKKYGKYNLPCDDPLMVVTDAGVELYDPAAPIFGSKPFFVLEKSEVEGLEYMPAMAELSVKGFLVLEKAWAILGYTYLDDKKEFGLVPNPATLRWELLLSDDIEPSSWRVRAPDGKYFDKERYRLGDTLEAMMRIYEETAKLTSMFRIPKQQLVLWRGAEGDSFDAFDKAISEFQSTGILFQVPVIKHITLSFHKQPELALQERSALIAANPNSIFVDHIGLSNAAGSALAAGLTQLVLTVPKGLEDHHETVWSSLENPSFVPPAVILKPANAILFALQHFAASNPLIYMVLRYKQEQRMVNSAVLNLGWQAVKV